MLSEKLLVPLYLFCLYFIELVVCFKVDSFLVSNDRPSKTPVGVPCLGEKNPGNCDGQEEAWYYDPSSQRCYFFMYSGCGGNGNRFSTLKSCKKACAPKSKCKISSCPTGCKALKKSDGCLRCSCSIEVARSSCLQVQRKGACRAIQHKWSYSKQDKKCVKFVYGGCDGNGNNFNSLEECQMICGRL